LRPNRIISAVNPTTQFFICILFALDAFSIAMGWDAQDSVFGLGVGSSRALHWATLALIASLGVFAILSELRAIRAALEERNSN
jgi:hypothetical protein